MREHVVTLGMFSGQILFMFHWEKVWVLKLCQFIFQSVSLFLSQSLYFTYTSNLI